MEAIFFHLFVMLGLAAMICLAVRGWDRSGRWHPYCSLRHRGIKMRRWVNGSWQYRDPMPNEVVDYQVHR